MTTKPSLIAYSVKARGENQKPIWNRIGAAWPHANGNGGLSLSLEVLPLDGRIVLMPSDKAEAAAE